MKIEAITTTARADTPQARPKPPIPFDDAGRLRMVGPVALFVHMQVPEVAPGELPPDADVRPHPHIGLVAMTYVIEGAITHRDSLGVRRELGPGDISFLVSGRGAVHSERFERMRVLGGRLEMVQILLALPDDAQDCEPSFRAVTGPEAPRRSLEGVDERWICGAPPGQTPALSLEVPVAIVDLRLDAGARHELPGDTLQERALYVAEGELVLGQTRLGSGQTALFGPGTAPLEASTRAHAFLVGGDAMPPRWAWWNFMHGSRETIERAVATWRARDGRTPAPTGAPPLPPPAGDTEAYTPAPADHERPWHHLNAPTP